MRSSIIMLVLCFAAANISPVVAQSESYLETIYQAVDSSPGEGQSLTVDYTEETMAADVLVIPGSASDTVETTGEPAELRINNIINDLLRILIGKFGGVSLSFKISVCPPLPPTATATSTITNTSTSTSTATVTATSTATITSTSTITTTATATATITATATATATATQTNTGTATSTSTSTTTSTSTATATSTGTATSTVPSPEEMTTAIDAGNAVEVKRLIAAGADVNWIDSSKRSYMMRAVNFGKNDVLKVLIDAGANLNARDIMNMTVLHYAATKNNAGAVPLLTAAGLNVDVRGFDSGSDGPTESTPLHMAAQSGAQEDALAVAAALISAGADVNALTNVKSGLFRRSPLFWAEKSGDIKMAELLKLHGAEKFPEGATLN